MEKAEGRRQATGSTACSECPMSGWLAVPRKTASPSRKAAEMEAADKPE